MLTIQTHINNLQNTLTIGPTRFSRVPHPPSLLKHYNEFLAISPSHSALQTCPGIKVKEEQESASFSIMPEIEAKSMSDNGGKYGHNVLRLDTMHPK